MKNINLKKFIALVLSVLMAVSCFTNGVFALDNDVDMDIRDLIEVSTNTVTGKQLVEGGLASYKGVTVSGDAATLNEDSAFIEFTVDCSDTVKANFTTDSSEPITFALYVDGLKTADITLTAGTKEIILESQLGNEECTIKLERTSPASAGNVSLNHLLLIYGNVLEVEEAMLGDVNSDEKLNLDDVVLLAQKLAGWNVEINMEVADVDGQVGISLNDAVVIAQYIAGWDVTLIDPGLINYPAVEATMKEVSANLKLTSRAAFDSSDKLKMDWSYSGFVMQGNLGGDIVLTNVVSWPASTVNAVLAYCVIDNDFENRKEVIISGMGAVGDITIVKNLKPGYHTVQFFKASEAWSVTVEGIKYNGTLDVAPVEKSKVIQVIGDSVTGGSGIVNAANNTPEAVYRSNISQSFGMLTARHFDAEFRVQSLSGSMFSYNADKASSYMYDRYLDKFITDVNSVYDFSTETQPDVVVIALGTNDAGIDTATVNEYVPKMLDMVREKHPNAKIVWFYGMMGVGLKADIKAAVEAYAANDSNVYYCQASHNDCSGFAGHPVASAHEIGANELIAFIESNDIL